MNAIELPKPKRTPTLSRSGGIRLAVAAAVCAAVSTVYVPRASAQETAAPVTERELVQLEQVVVTARRREELLQDIPIAVTAFDNQFLREQNITNIGDLGIYIPSFRISDSAPGTNSPIVTLRGQRPSDVGLTVDPAIPIYFAEIPLTPNQGTNLAMYDLASVQVLKGPQGTLFGRNSTGGALLLTPVAPGEELGGYGEVRVGNYDLLHFEGAVDLPASDTLQFRLAGRSIDRDGYQDNVADNSLRGDEQYWDEDSYGVRLSANWAPTDRLINYTVVSYDENDILARVPVPQMYNSSVRISTLVEAIHNGGALSPPSLAGITSVDDAVARQQARDNAFEIETDMRAREKVENTLFANTTEYELTDNLTFKNIFGYRDLSFSSNSDADGTAVPLFGAIQSTTDNVTLNPPTGGMSSEQYSDELQLLGNAFDDKLEWIAGAFWMEMDGSQKDFQNIVGPNPNWPAGGSGVGVFDYVATNGSPNLPNFDVNNTAYALFGEGTWTFNEQWAVTGGLRQSYDEREMTVKSFMFDAAALDAICGVFDENDVRLPDDNCSRKVDEDFDKLTWRSAVSFTPVDKMLIYGSVSTGYRTGGFNSRGGNNFTLQPFDEETVLTYEIGHKTDWDLGNLAAMRTNLAIYLQEYDDIQKTVSGSNPDTGAFETYVINAAKAEIPGIEFDVMVAPTDSLVLTFGWAYVDPEYKDWPRAIDSGPNQGQVVDYSESKFEWIPKNSLTTSVAYTLPLDAAVGELTLGAYGYWQDDMDTNDDAWIWPQLGWKPEDLQAALDSSTVDDYSVWNFRADWNGAMGSAFDVAAFVNNAFDEEYATGGLTVPESLGWVGFSYAAPRTYGASLRYRF